MLKTQDTLFLAIDIQEKLVKMIGENNSCSKNCEKLLQTAEILNIPTIVTEQYPKGLGKTINTIQKANKNSKYYEKKTFSAYSNLEIRNEIEKSKKQQIVISGIETHICVLQTVLELKSEGYEIYLVKDACGSRKQENHNTAIERLKFSGITITDTETTLFELIRSSEHKNFKEVQSLIK